MSSVGQKEITTQQRIMMLFRNNPSYIYFSEPGFTKPSSRVTTEETREKTREKILALIAENPRITTGEMAELLGITAKGVEWQIKKLKEADRIERVGPDKGGDWKIMEVNDE